MLIDGGKGQLDAALRARDEQAATQQRSYQGIPFIGIAKKEEQNCDRTRSLSGAIK